LHYSSQMTILCIMSSRKVKKFIAGKHTLEGAGVHLQRVFGFYEMHLFDPFLLLDDFRSDDPSHYLLGFPWHPHRGIETITYVLEGDVEHGDSMGNKGSISAGDVQWMTAGSGIIHQEMPKGNSKGQMYGFQLWANLPSSNKMMAPRYRGISAAAIPDIALNDKVNVKIISGECNGVKGPVQDIIIDPEYFDVTMKPDAVFSHFIKDGHTAFIYVIGGTVLCGDEKVSAKNGTCVLFEKTGSISVETHNYNGRFLLVSGRPLMEPIAWHGPIVMNTDEELRIAFEEYDNGTFIKHKI
jgi:quercetin 2,3-dioxygenase